MLELGAGAGNNAFYLKQGVRCTLTDRSSEMLALSEAVNPECEHALGDMRSVRLDRTFDAVLVHDAVCYLTSEADLLACAETAFAHTRPGGAAIFAPDHVGTTAPDATEWIDRSEGERALRGVIWTWDPAPGDGRYSVDFSFLLRESGELRAVHDAHVEGLFTEDAWQRVLGAAGFDVETVSRAIPGDYGETEHIFLCRRR
jgi:SAM-dependent methyltransferase